MVGIVAGERTIRRLECFGELGGLVEGVRRQRRVRLGAVPRAVASKPLDYRVQRRHSFAQDSLTQDSFAQVSLTQFLGPDIGRRRPDPGHADQDPGCGRATLRLDCVHVPSAGATSIS